MHGVKVYEVISPQVPDPRHIQTYSRVREAQDQKVFWKTLVNEHDITIE